MDAAVGALDEFKSIAEDIEALKRIFDALDADKSGSISPEEFKLVLKQSAIEMSNEELAEVIRECDSSGRGLINFDDFLKVLMVGLATSLPAKRTGFAVGPSVWRRLGFGK